MANHASARKVFRVSKRRELENKLHRGRAKTMIRKVLLAIEVNKGSTEVIGAFRIAESAIAKCYSKGVIKRNTMARRVSRLHRRVKNYCLAHQA